MLTGCHYWSNSVIDGLHTGIYFYPALDTHRVSVFDLKNDGFV
jgi:hypothetical protein